MGFNDFMAGLGKILTGFVGAGMKNVEREYRAGRLDDDTYYSLQSDYSKLQSKNAKYQSRAETDRIQREAEERERQRRLAEERERQRQQSEMLVRKKEFDEKIYTTISELNSVCTNSKYHQKTKKKLTHLQNKIDKIIIKNNGIIFLNEKSKGVLEYEFSRLGYSNLSIIKMTMLWIDLAYSIEKITGDSWDEDIGDETIENFMLDYADVLKYMDIKQDEISTLEYIPTENYNQQFYSFCNDYVDDDVDFILLRERNA